MLLQWNWCASFNCKCVQRSSTDLELVNQRLMLSLLLFSPCLKRKQSELHMSGCRKAKENFLIGLCTCVG